jgi:hypothetical protein
MGVVSILALRLGMLAPDWLPLEREISAARFHATKKY